MEESDIVELSDTYNITDFFGASITREIKQNTAKGGDIDCCGFDSFMLKEIFEEADVVRKTSIATAEIDLSRYKSICLLACGTSYYAAVLAKFWFEENLAIATTAEIASEFRYRKTVLSADTLYILISQSGETADTLGALKKLRDFDTLGLVNVEQSSIARESKQVIYMNAGPEIGVASTKNLIAQMTALLCLSKKIEPHEIINIQTGIRLTLERQFKIKALAEKLIGSRAIFYIGRGTSFPIALEGALKLKELSYIQAQGIEGGELKHGSLAVIDKTVFTVALAPFDEYFNKIIANINEILARDGSVLIISTENARDFLENTYKGNSHINIIYCPELIDKEHYPFVLATAVHLLAYYTASLCHHDVDKPRNLAKSVTVE